MGSYKPPSSFHLQTVLTKKKSALLLPLPILLLFRHLTRPDELSTLLHRKGHAAVAILRTIDPIRSEPRYLVQIKSHDYPIPSFRGSVCLLGGNADPLDVTPLDTLVRELGEELGFPSWLKEIRRNGSEEGEGRIRYLGMTEHFQSASILEKPNPYSFVCALYEITLDPADLPPSVVYPRGANVMEGRVALLSREQLIHHSKYSWGYDYTMGRYFGENVTHVCEGVEVSEIDGESGEWGQENM